MKEKFKKIIFWIFLISLIFIGIWSYYYLIKPASLIDVSLPYGTYAFGIRDLNGKIIRDVYLEHDFQKDQGFFRFRIGGKGIINKFRVEFPDQLNITNFTLTDWYNDSAYKLTEKQFTIFNPGGVGFRDLNKLGLEGVEVLINFTSINNSFYPNGRFIFVADGVKEMTLNDDEVDAHYGNLLKFEFGNKYRCSEQCFIIEKLNLDKNLNLKDGLNAFPNQNQFFVSSGNNDYDIGGLAIFTISTFDFSKKEKALTKLNFGIAMVSGVIIGLILFLLQVLMGGKLKVENKKIIKK